MGQKVSPIGLRIGVNKDWESKWFSSNKDYAKYLNNDIKIRKFLAKKLKEAAVASVVIERNDKRCDVTIKSAKPGVIIGKGGEDIEKLRNELKKLVGEDIYVSIVEVKNPDLNAQIVAQNIALQIEARAPFRSVQKRAIRNTMKAGAKGIKTLVSGRVGGAEMARSEGYTEGTVPLHTVRADIDYGTAEALTTYGIIGVKVWIYKGELRLDGDPIYVIDEYLKQVAIDHKEEKKKAIAEGKHKFKAAVFIDAPKSFATIEKNQGSLFCQGWQISDHDDAVLKVMLDGKEINDVERISRLDVFDAYQEAYAGELDPETIGWCTTLDLTKLDLGTHKFDVQCLEPDGSILSDKSIRFTLE